MLNKLDVTPYDSLSDEDKKVLQEMAVESLKTSTPGIHCHLDSLFAFLWCLFYRDNAICLFYRDKQFHWILDTMKYL